MSFLHLLLLLPVLVVVNPGFFFLLGDCNADLDYQHDILCFPEAAYVSSSPECLQCSKTLFEELNYKVSNALHQYHCHHHHLLLLHPILIYHRPTIVLCQFPGLQELCKDVIQAGQVLNKISKNTKQETHI